MIQMPRYEDLVAFKCRALFYLNKGSSIRIQDFTCLIDLINGSKIPLGELIDIGEGND